MVYIGKEDVFVVDSFVKGCVFFFEGCNVVGNGKYLFGGGVRLIVLLYLNVRFVFFVEVVFKFYSWFVFVKFC